jgi:hypothetical protein
MVTGGALRGVCALHGNRIPDKMGWASLYSSQARGYLGACSVECWDSLKRIEKPSPLGYADDRYVDRFTGQVSLAG